VLEKPVIFFSHSSKDAEALKHLKQRFVELTADTIEVFLSSDGQSIRLGKNWLARVEEALKGAKAMFVFLTPNSMASPWVYFESGHAYSKGIDVVPVGLFGVDVGTIPPPLSTLQGFNATGADSLNNIIAKVNELFTTKHKLGFTAEDFLALEGETVGARQFFGRHALAVQELRFETQNPVEPEPLADVFAKLEGPKVGVADSFSIPGATIERVTSILPNRFQGTVETQLVHETFPVIESIFKRLFPGRTEESLSFEVQVWFHASVRSEWQTRIIMGRLHRTEAVLSLEKSGGLRYKWRSLYFRCSETFPTEGRHSQPILVIESEGESFADSGIGELIDLLFECGVYTYRPDY
jgi:hypothetical protein